VLEQCWQALLWLQQQQSPELFRIPGIFNDPLTLLLINERIAKMQNMSIEKFQKLISTVVPLPIENVDTDQIIPARFLKAVERQGFGDNLFRDWRYMKDGKPNPDFVLNNSRFSGQILAAGKNFGSGSSREHAAWAIYDAGFRVVVSSFFADIFKSNVLNCGLLPVQVNEDFLEEIFRTVNNDPDAQFEIDLENQTMRNIRADSVVKFDINQYKKQCLLRGLDDIDFLLSLKEEITAFEFSRS
jgi:3-isopropylmalate/(R)-2-methylmalate dehydratase small subunit